MASAAPHDSTLAPAQAAHLRTKLLAWFAGAKRDLPWRRTSDPYAVLVSETMLQQTRVDVVIDYFERFMHCYPDAAALAAADVDDVLGLWSGLGYYRRARSLHAAAAVVAREYGGEFPTTLSEVLALPGVGPYTAGAVLSIACGQREALVDGNVERVFSRLFGIDAAAGTGALTKPCWGLARQLVADAQDPGDWNQALMELGALVCTPKSPACPECPLRADCVALRERRAEELPRKKPRPAPIDVELEVVCVLARGKLLLEQRPEDGRMASLWQFPTRELESAGGPHLFPDAWPQGATGKALVWPTAGGPLGTLRHSITRHRIRAVVRRGELVGARPSGRLRWVRPGELSGLGLTGMTKKVLKIARGTLGVEIPS